MNVSNSIYLEQIKVHDFKLFTETDTNSHFKSTSSVREQYSSDIYITERSI